MRLVLGIIQILSFLFFQVFFAKMWVSGMIVKFPVIAPYEELIRYSLAGFIPILFAPAFALLTVVHLYGQRSEKVGAE